MSQLKPGASKIQQACGHFSLFVLRANDRYAKERLTKFMRLKCKDCRRRDRIAREIEEEKAAKRKVEGPAPEVKKEGEVKLPAGTKLELERKGDGGWRGSLLAAGVTISGESKGMIKLIKLLTENWAKAAPQANEGKPEPQSSLDAS